MIFGFKRKKSKGQNVIAKRVIDVFLVNKITGHVRQGILSKNIRRPGVTQSSRYFTFSRT